MPDRTTIVLSPYLKERAVACAREEGISFAEFVRRAVEQKLEPRRGAGEKTGNSFLDNLVTFEDDGPADLSTRVDEIVYGALEDELRGYRRVSGASSKKRSVSRGGRPLVAKPRPSSRNQQSRNR